MSIEPSIGKEDNPLNGWLHSLSLYVEPINDGFPHLLMTGIDLYKRGKMPRGLDGLRINQSLETGDYPTPWITLGRWIFGRPWIRPGSTVGMAAVNFEPGSVSSSAGGYNPRKHLYLGGQLVLAIDRIAEDQWRVEVEVQYECEVDSKHQPLVGGIPAGDFRAVYVCPLEVEAY